MIRLTFKGLLLRKARAAMTAIAVVLGVSLISGTFILTDSINNAFDDVFAQANKGFDVVVSPKQVIDNTDAAAPPPFSARELEKVKRVDGVDRAVGTIFTDGVIFGKDGKRVGFQGTPNFIASAAPEPFDPFAYPQGHAPRANGQVVLDRHTARREHFKVGDTVALSGNGPQHKFRLVGLATFGDAESLAGASAAIVTLHDAQLVAGKVGELDEIDMTAAPGVTPDQLRSRVDDALPASVTVRTSKQQASKQAKDIKDAFKFLSTALLAFGGIALFVGAFMIANTFSITVAQRTREFAMLRTLGASRRQVLGSVVFEAIVIGLIGSLLGLLAGLGLAPALNEAFKAFGAELPQGGTTLQTRTIVVALITGTLVTLVASLTPAIRATRVPPLAALREGALPPSASRGKRWRARAAAALVTLGFVVLMLGLFGGGSGNSVAALLGLGAVLIFFGMVLVTPRLVGPLTTVVGAPLERLRGMTGRLARENATRNPSRTASTAGALMIGLTLVAFVSIFAAGLRGSISQAIDDGFNADLVVQNSDGFSPFGASAAADLSKVPGVAQSTGIRMADSLVAKKRVSVGGVEPSQVEGLYKLDWRKGKGSDATLAQLGPRDAVVSQKLLDDNKLKLGGRFTATTPRGHRVAFTIRGVYRKRELSFSNDFTVANATLASEFGQKKDSFVLLGLASGADSKRVKAAVARELKASYPETEVVTSAGFKTSQSGGINKLVGLIYVLLSLSVIVSLFGIVNTLALSIHERIRELGLLRAIGTSRAQVRQVVRYESVITALIGAVLGTSLGVLFALIISRPLAKEGFTLTIPVGTLALLLVLAAIAGVVAAISPARRAARLDVLEAVAYE